MSIQEKFGSIAHSTGEELIDIVKNSPSDLGNVLMWTLSIGIFVGGYGLGGVYDALDGKGLDNKERPEQAGAIEEYNKLLLALNTDKEVHVWERDVFVSSVILDKRLNEENIQSLLEEFEDTHGLIGDVTRFNGDIDYEDLIEMRNFVGDGSHNEMERTSQIINYSSGPKFDLHTASGTFLALLCFFVLTATQKNGFERLKNGKPMKLKYKH